MTITKCSRVMFRMRGYGSYHSGKFYIHTNSFYYPSLGDDSCKVVDGGTVLVLSDPTFGTDPRNKDYVSVIFVGMVEDTAKISLMYFYPGELRLIRQ